MYFLHLTFVTPPLPKKKIYLCTKASVQSSVYISNETRQAFMKLKQGDLLKGLSPSKLDKS